MKRFVAVILVLLVLLCAASAGADTPFESYTFNGYAYRTPLPAPYVYEREISGESLGVGAFNTPSDVFCSEIGALYISDTGSRRIVCITEGETEVIDGYMRNGVREEFQTPAGLYERHGVLFVADTSAGRVLALAKTDHTWHAVYVIENPTSDLFDDDFVFAPTKIAVDAADRLYVICRNALEGILYFDGTHEFMGYFGTIKVQVTVPDLFWRMFATQEQRSKMELFVPTEFLGLDMDAQGFLMTTQIISDVNDQAVKRLNPSGTDVLINYADFGVVGDIDTNTPSRLVDIVSWKGGMYTALDSARGRIFCYDGEGRLLYAFAGMGSERGTLRKPAAIEQDDTRIYVLDQARNTLVVYRTTEFGTRIREAILCGDAGEDEQAERAWRETLELCANYEPALAGIGKAYLNAGDHANAALYLERGMDKRYYSVALKRLRTETIRTAFPYVLGALFAVAIARRVIARVKRRRAHA